MGERQLSLLSVMQHGSTSAPFHWQRSDNSFTFNFSPEIAPSSPQSIMDHDDSPPGDTVDSETGSGFAFNFQIPAGTVQESDRKLGLGETVRSEATRGSETNVDSKPKVTKKKKKKTTKTNKSGAGGGEEAAEKNANKPRVEALKQESTELTPEQQLSRELDWCIEQLELGLRTQKSSTKQKEEACRALKTLRSSKAPMVKKRQVMRAVSGDYRKKMEEDKERQYKLIRTATSSAKVTRVSEPRCGAVCHRHAQTLKAPAHRTDTSEASLSAEQSHGVGDTFVFRPSGEEFHFNFSL